MGWGEWDGGKADLLKVLCKCSL